MRGLLRTAQYAVLFVVVSLIPCPSFGDQPTPNGTSAASETNQTGVGEAEAVAELLTLIEQLDSLRAPIPYVNYHDQALAVQTDLQRRRRRAGFHKKAGPMRDYDPSRGWSVEGRSSGSRGSSRGR